MSQINTITDRFGYDDIEPEDDLHSDFPCPYCYEDHDVASLCAHLEDEHPFESKIVSCPVCSARISKDLVDHITLQHGYLFKISFLDDYIFLDMFY
ncbi:drought-induced 19 [Zea mays]|uniref:Drought-induced 19 n=1 Tax=Zea mays TaxID=4577 RepID=A0A1D6H7N1_MAIZE|nr:drought-induced 19 [Zea mays]